MTEVLLQYDVTLKNNDDIVEDIGSKLSSAIFQVFDEYDWVTTHVELKDHATGNILYDKNIEHPKKWSYDAVRICSSKYFSPKETSIKQMIHRVVFFISYNGFIYGYHVNIEGSMQFAMKLTRILLNQEASFNSPIWFNFGKHDSPQGSACQPYNSLINTPQGLMKIGDIVTNKLIDQEVYSFDGITHVKAVKHNGQKEVFRITLTSGNFIEVTEDHLVCVHTKRKKIPLEWKTVGELQSGEYMRMYLNNENTCNISSQQLLSESALAGWLQADGSVGRYLSGVRSINPSLRVEFDVINSDEETWVLNHFKKLFPTKHFGIASVESKITPNLITMNRIIIYGEEMASFVDKYDLLARGLNLRVPTQIMTAPLDVVSNYLKSVFQSDGYIRNSNSSSHIELATISKQWMEDIQILLGRFGIYSRLFMKIDKRENRHNLWVIAISNLSERIKYAEHIGFVSSEKNNKMFKGLDRKGKILKNILYRKIKSIKNIGMKDVYDIQTENETYLTNGILVHNCFIQSVADNLESISQLGVKETKLFSRGSGSGTNYSKLRAKGEKLSKGGFSSGSVSFINGLDAMSGTIKSGGTCLAPYQKVITNTGAIEVQKLIDKKFNIFSYDKIAGRVMLKPATAFKSGYKKVYRLITDKGEFHLTGDHPILMTNGNYIIVNNLKAGMSIMPLTIDIAQNKYYRVSLRDGQNSRMRLHRMMAQDIMKKNISDMSVHHINENSFDNSENNLEVISQSKHAKRHNDKLVKEGNHVFQNNYFGQKGKTNPMHSSSVFWKDDEKVSALKQKHRDNMTTDQARTMQKVSIKQKMLNFAYNLINNGYKIDTLDKYIKARTEGKSRIGDKRKVVKAFDTHFGGYSNFYKELRANNHVVVGIQEIRMMDVYDVQVECNSINEPVYESNHNFAVGDSLEGSSIIIHNTRRSAKMIILDMDHPDIEEFIETKVLEEDKMRVLARAGYDVGMDSNVRLNASFQNGNHSVRVTNEFMHLARVDQPWKLTGRVDNSIDREVSARELLMKVAVASHKTGDPAIQFDDIINNWHTAPHDGRINASNPCGEYMHCDETSCNLASIKMTSMLVGTNGSTVFDVERYKEVIKILIYAMDIIVESSMYPTEDIEFHTKRHRNLGLGFTDLGALFMTMGYAYDSPESRALASVLTAILTGEAYMTSMELAKDMGSCDGFNADHMGRVLKLHASEFSRLSEEQHELFSLVEYEQIQENLRKTAETIWNYIRNEIDMKSFGMRNNQVTLQAPAGTVSFKMDATTTGIEPDFGLKKSKQFVGGEYMNMVNPLVEICMRKRGFNDTDIATIIRCVNDDLPLPDWADVNKFKILACAMDGFQGTLPAISVDGHLMMMASIQPLISGGISKTVNLPKEATPDQIYDLYMRAYDLELKSVAIYRDGSKVTQALSIDGTFDTVDEIPEPFGRYKLPALHPAKIQRASINGATTHIIMGFYPDDGNMWDGKLGEVFINMGKQGTTVNGLLEAIGRLISISLQNGIDVDDIAHQMAGMNFSPQGFVHGVKGINMTHSILDLLSSILTQNKTVDKIDSVDPVEEFTGRTCQNCGSTDLVRTGNNCFACQNCGNSGECS